MQHVADLIALAEHVSRLDEPWAGPMSARLDRLLAGHDPAEALGLKPKRGQRRWHTVTRIDQRDEMLRQAAMRFFPGMAPSRQAEEIARALKRYAASSWRYDQLKADCPHPNDTLKAMLWLVLRHVDNALSARRVRKILRSTRITSADQNMSY
jgi:hypothetical protein